MRQVEGCRKIGSGFLLEFGIWITRESRSLVMLVMVVIMVIGIWLLS